MFSRSGLLRASVLAASLAIGAVGVANVSGTPRTGASAATAPTARAPQFGIATGCCTPSGVTLADQVPGIAATGAQWARIGFNWSSEEPQAGVFSFDRDDVVSSFTHTGMKILGVIAYSPSWAAAPTCYQTYSLKCPPVDPATFAQFAATLAERYDGDGVNDAPGSPVVDAWEIWNEPNLANFWRPSPNPAAYTTLLRAADAAIRTANPRATVVSGGLSPAGGTFSPLKFLAAMYADGAQGSFDALGFHPYSYPAMPLTIANWNAWQQMFSTFPSVGQTDSLRTLMIANGDSAKKIWATEFGAPTYGDTNGDGVSHCNSDGINLGAGDQCVTEDRQAQMVSQAYQQWLSYPWSGPLFWFSFQDIQSGSLDIQDNFGLERTNGTKKPGYAAYVKAAAAAAPKTTTTSVRTKR